MRDDIRAIIENRPSWRLMQDGVYKDLVAAREIALKEKDLETVRILDEMISQHKDTILNNLNPGLFAVSRSAT